jgi:D-glycero-alpha-D-manno-heptose-7-phosphate kinase
VRRVTARAPTRIDFGGGWTDVPPYCEREGGFVCNVAITRYATATLTHADVRGRKRRSSPGRSPVRRLTPVAIVSDDDPLIRAVLRRAGETDLHALLSSDFPVGAGLGGSSAASAALLGALTTWRGEPLDRPAIAEEGRRIEVEELGIAGGRQDHYAATHGGALALTFSSSVEVRRLALSSSTIDAIEGRGLLLYTHESRVSGSTITAVLDGYEARERRVVDALARMRALAQEMAGTLERGDVDSLGLLLHEHWTHQRSLHPAIPTALIDEIVARAGASGALGAKAMGASGGGCVLVIARDDNVEQVRKAISPLGTLLTFKVDSEGLALV